MNQFVGGCALARLRMKSRKRLAVALPETRDVRMPTQRVKSMQGIAPAWNRNPPARL